MYTDRVTIFCRYGNRDGDTWFPFVVTGDFNADRARIVAKYGENTVDNAKLHIRFTVQGNRRFIDGFEYLQPKEWMNQPADKRQDTLTFQSGSEFGFFWLGEWDGAEVINDNDYDDGFYNYMNRTNDHVYSISKHADYSVIPHVEIFGR